MMNFIMLEENKMENVYDIAIIGSGPAGMTAGLYAVRANLKTLIIEKNIPGGKMNMTACIENYPGFSLVEGTTLAFKMYEQLEKAGVNYIFGDVKEIVNEPPYKIIKTETEEIKAKAVIIATGTTPKKLEVKGEAEYTGRGISWCAICDGKLYAGKDVAVIGGGNSALEEALYLSNIVNHVYLIHRRDEFRGEESLQEKVLKNEKITVLYDTVVLEFLGDENKLTELKLKNTKTEQISTLKVSGCFIFIGAIPATEFCLNLGILNEQGYIKVNHKMETNIPGIYAVGDVIEKDLRQIVTAINDGAIAAINAQKYIETL